MNEDYDTTTHKHYNSGHKQWHTWGKTKNGSKENKEFKPNWGSVICNVILNKVMMHEGSDILNLVLYETLWSYAVGLWRIRNKNLNEEELGALGCWDFVMFF